MRASSGRRCVSTVPPWMPTATPSRSCSRPPRRSLVECWLAPVEARPGRALGRGAVDQVVQALVEVGQDLRLLVGRQLLVGHGLIELLADGVLHRRLQAGDVLVLGLGDIGERLAGLQLRAQRVLAEPEVGGRRIEAEAAEVTRAAGAVRATGTAVAEAGDTAETEHRSGAGGEALLDFVTLRLGQLAGGDGRVDPRLGGALDGRVELIARDVQPLGDIIEKGFLLSSEVGRLDSDLARRGGGRTGGICAPASRQDRETG